MVSEPVNGAESSLEDRIQAAQQRLAKAVLQQPMNPQSAAISSYINTVLLSARMDGVVAFLTTDYDASWTKEEALDNAILGSLNTVAEKLEENARRIQVSGPSLIAPH